MITGPTQPPAQPAIWLSTVPTTPARTAATAEIISRQTSNNTQPHKQILSDVVGAERVVS
ncbi:hypothetical protein [Brevibacterium sp. FAM 24638]|uniref:hypothetical protein n=1 Tax=Brevibacterium sp. FAM 24638 TaxID=3415681 RepID=UPI003C7BB888